MYGRFWVFTEALAGGSSCPREGALPSFGERKWGGSRRPSGIRSAALAGVALLPGNPPASRERRSNPSRAHSSTSPANHSSLVVPSQGRRQSLSKAHAMAADLLSTISPRRAVRALFRVFLHVSVDPEALKQNRTSCP